MGTWGKALVIDDEESIRSLLREYFETIGFSVVDAADGQEGIAAFRRHSPNIVFTDLRMPGLDGFTVIETMRRESPGTPVFAISGCRTSSDEQRATRLGAWGCLQKPLVLPELASTAKKALEQAKLIACNRDADPRLEALVAERTKELQESEARYRALFESANDALLLLENGKIITCNSQARILFGCSEDQILNRSLVSFAPLLQPEGTYSEELMPKYLSEALQGEPQFYDWTCARQNGEPFDGEISMSRIVLNEKVYLQAAVRDITTRRQQNALISTLSAAVTQSANLIVITDPEGRILYTNPRFSEVTGRSADETIGRTLDILKSELHEPAYYDAMWKAVLSGRVWHGELGNRTSGNRVFWVSATIAPVRDTSGAVANCIAVMEDVTDRKQSAERLYYQANYDSLTGLPNRFLLHELLTREVENVKDRGGRFCLLLLDINDLKNINDTLGHAQGDELLRQLGERLRTIVAGGEAIGRFTGAEFAMIAAGAGPDRAAALARRVDDLTEMPFSIGPTELFIALSIGVVICPDDGDSVADLFRNAEAAMFAARKQGSGVQFFTSAISRQVNERVSLERRLRKALERNEFSLDFQPQVDLASRSVPSVEALLRWRPGGEPVPPNRFIPVLEETGLIVPISEWALWHACALMRAWLDRGAPAPRVSVNISALQFRSGRLADTVRGALEEYRLPASSLCLELTESIVMHSMDETIKTLHVLNEMGIRISIDDFGTGYSSLGCLRRMPIQELKIDQSFVMNVPADAGSAAIVNTILSMARDMNLEVVAEGVETQGQLDFLASRNCQKIQGFFFSKPLCAEDLPETLLHWDREARGNLRTS